MKYKYCWNFISEGDSIEIPDNSIGVSFDAIHNTDRGTGRILTDRSVHWLEPILNEVK